MPSSYGVPSDASGAELAPWTWARDELERARNYWICTTRPDGRPHAAPVWAVWVDDALWFSTSPQSQKGRNLARDPHVVVHLESGDDVVILEGDAVRSECPDRVREAYETKYAYRLEPGNSDTPLFAVRPRVAQTWRERDFPKSAVRWMFD